MEAFEARQHAIHYLNATKKTREHCNENIGEGAGGPGEPGWYLSHGKIRIGRGFEHEFRTDDLFDEIERGQQDLFGGLFG